MIKYYFILSFTIRISDLVDVAVFYKFSYSHVGSETVSRNISVIKLIVEASKQLCTTYNNNNY